MYGVSASNADENEAPQPPERAVPRTAPVPASLVIAAGWAWRVLVVAGAFLALGGLFSKLYLVTLPVFFALLLAALLHPLVAVLRRWHLSRLFATLGTLIIALVVLGGIGWFVVSQVAANSDGLIAQVKVLLDKAQRYAAQLPFVNADALKNLQDRLLSAVESNSAVVARDILKVGSVTVKVITGLIVMLFVTFFFLDEGDRIWAWAVRLLPRDVQPSALGAGYRAWNVLSGWIVGTAIIAAFHGIILGTVLGVMGVPLALPLAVLIFVGSFVPVVGVLVFGGLAVLITLITQGWILAVIVLGILVLTNQIEAHVLQPFIVGRAVKLHPVAIALSLTGGALVAGVFGAIVAIPIVAAVHAAVKYLTGVEDLDGTVRRGKKDRMATASPPLYAPLPLYAGRGDLPDAITAQEDPVDVVSEHLGVPIPPEEDHD